MWGRSMELISQAAMSPEESIPKRVPSSLVTGMAATLRSAVSTDQAWLTVTAEDRAGGVS